jgi:hypothetical protein
MQNERCCRLPSRQQRWTQAPSPTCPGTISRAAAIRGTRPVTMKNSFQPYRPGNTRRPHLSTLHRNELR